MGSGWGVEGVGVVCTGVVVRYREELIKSTDNTKNVLVTLSCMIVLSYNIEGAFHVNHGETFYIIIWVCM